MGIQLYHSLATQFRLVVDSSHDDINDIEHWLQVNALKRHTLILHREPEQAHLDDLMLRRTHLGEWRGQGFDVALYVTSSPSVAAAMMNQGCPALLLAHPQFARPEYRPDHQAAMRPWNEIEDEITGALALRESVPRIDAEMDFEQ